MSTPTLDWAGKCCGHNHPPEACPWPRCGYREALERIARLLELLKGIAVDEAASDPRMKYLDAQIDKPDWALIKAELSDESEGAD